MTKSADAKMLNTAHQRKCNQNHSDITTPVRMAINVNYTHTKDHNNKNVVIIEERKRTLVNY